MPFTNSNNNPNGIQRLQTNNCAKSGYVPNHDLGRNLANDKNSYQRLAGATKFGLQMNMSNKGLGGQRLNNPYKNAAQYSAQSLFQKHRSAYGRMMATANASASTTELMSEPTVLQPAVPPSMIQPQKTGLPQVIPYNYGYQVPPANSEKTMSNPDFQIEGYEESLHEQMPTLEEFQDVTFYGKFRTDLPEQEGFSPELISSDLYYHKDTTNVDELEILPFEGIDTLPKALQRQLYIRPNHELLGTKVGDKYEWMTIKETVETAKHIAAGIAALDLAPMVEAEDRPWRFLGIQAKNRKEWNLFHLANQHNAITTVTLYDTLGTAASQFICDQTELTSIATSANLVERICSMKLGENDPEGKMKKVKTIISFEDEVPVKGLKMAEQVGVNIVTMNEIIEAGKKNTFWRETVASPDDIMLISYTSGTSGNPKGVKVTQKQVIQTVMGMQTKLLSSKCPPLDHTDTYISYLPAAHIFEQAVFGFSLIWGMRCGFFSGDPTKMIREDLPALKPTFFPGVPRVFNSMYGIIQGKVKQATGVKGFLLNQGLSHKIKKVKNKGEYNSKLYDKIIFSKFREIFGGNVRFMINGSAPIADDVIDFLKACFCVPIVEGYGMTESCGGSIVSCPGDPVSGHVGGPMSNVKVKLKDIPEMGYSSKNTPPTGEICMKGTGIMSGYFKDPENTKDAMTEDGWLRSGDVAQINPNGSIQIIDRAKNIFKTSFGEYIAPDRLESIFIQSLWINQVWIYGDSLKDALCMIAVVDPAKVSQYAKENNLENNDELLDDMDLKCLVMGDVNQLAKENKLQIHEKPKYMKLISDPFSVDNGLLTPTMKLKRNIAKEYFAKEIEEMYEKQEKIIGKKN